MTASYVESFTVRNAVYIIRKNKRLQLCLTPSKRLVAGSGEETRPGNPRRRNTLSEILFILNNIPLINNLIKKPINIII